MGDSVKKYEEGGFEGPKRTLDFKLGRLVREHDGIVKVGRIGFVEWGEDGSFVDIHTEPQIGFSIMVDPQRISFTWLTTPITEIGENGYLKTGNSIYKLEM